MTHLKSRRSLLHDAAKLGMLGMLSPTLASLAASEPSAPRWQMRLSTSSIQFSKLPIEQACEKIAALGFAAIDIWSAYQGCPHLDDVLTRLGPEGLKSLLQKHKLKLFSFSVYVGGYAKYAELLGRSGGGIAIRGGPGPCPPAEIPARMKAFIESLKPELDLCEKHNSRLAIENHGSSLLDSLDSIKAFVETNKHPRLGLALAPYHLQASKVPVEQAIATAGPQLLFFYAWQNGEGLKQLPGHGPTDFTPWLSALAASNYAGYVNPFMHNHPDPVAMSAALAKSRNYLESCRARASAPAAWQPLAQSDLGIEPRRE